MKNISRLLTNILSDKLKETKDFYISLFDFSAAYESDWYIQLVSDKQQVELGIIDQKSDLIPTAFQQPPKGFYLTFVVDSADELFDLVQAKNYTIVSPPQDTFYGQRRFLITDPNGVLVDVSSIIR